MRNLSIDYLKVALALSVVLLHLNFLRVDLPELGFILVNGVFRLAVPLFLIITGYYFTQITTFGKFKSWFFRILILYVIWMIFYLPYWFNPNDLLRTLLDIPKKFSAIFHSNISDSSFLYKRTELFVD
jgi:fucose 4-O-acetylase-like acetyltransferase